MADEPIRVPMPVHRIDFDRGVANPDPIINVRVKGLFGEGGVDTIGMFGRLTHAIDSEGNLWPIVGQDPGRVTRCDACHREVYVPDALVTYIRTTGRATVACPYRDCLGVLDSRPRVGDFLVEDAPAQIISGRCPDHDIACQPPKAQTRLAS